MSSSVINFDSKPFVAKVFCYCLVFVQLKLFQTPEISKLGVLLPAAKSFPVFDQPLLLFTKGPGKGKDLALVTRTSPQIIGRNASKQLWTDDEMKIHMLSPKGKKKQGAFIRTDFSPVRKEQLEGLSKILETLFLE